MRKFSASVSADIAPDLRANRNLSYKLGMKCAFTMFDSLGEFIDFAEVDGVGIGREDGNEAFRGSRSYAEAVAIARAGDLSSVPASEKIMERFEKFAFESAGKGWRDDVVGALPNVPAFLAGHPMNMRRRVRQESAAAPIAIVLDLFVSMAVTREEVLRRGVAALALVRLLAMRRPVELWIGVGSVTGGGEAAYHFIRIDTAPLDLLTSAHAISSPSFLRRLLFSTIRIDVGASSGIPPVGISDKTMAKLIAPAFSHVSETLCLPGMVSGTSLVDAEKWVETQLAKLAPVALDA